MTAPPFRSVWFDCDSTLSRIEGIDELARPLPDDVRARLMALTDQAMNGERSLAEVYEERLREIAPSRSQCESVARLYAESAVEDAADVIAALRHLGIAVGVVSGGLLPPVLGFARWLGVPDEQVRAVPIEFDAQGRYVDFDHSSPLWRNGGKHDVFAALSGEQRPVCFVGDGITDLEATDVVDLFVGFGGVARRAAVERTAERYVRGPGLAPLLEIVLTGEQRERLRADGRFAELC